MIEGSLRGFGAAIGRPGPRLLLAIPCRLFPFLSSGPPRTPSEGVDFSLAGI